MVDAGFDEDVAFSLVTEFLVEEPGLNLRIQSHRPQALLACVRFDRLDECSSQPQSSGVLENGNSLGFRFVVNDSHSSGPQCSRCFVAVGESEEMLGVPVETVEFDLRRHRLALDKDFASDLDAHLISR